MASGKFTFDEDAFLINLVSPFTGFTGVELYSDAAEYAALVNGSSMSHTQPVVAAGKFPLGAGVNSDSIFTVQEPWKVKPYGGTYRLVIEGTVITDGAIDIDYNTQTVAFTLGDYVVGGTSDATGIILADTVAGVGDGTLTIGHVTGVFVDGEVLTDDSAGSASASSSPADVVTSPVADAPSGTVTVVVIAASSGTVAFSEEINNQSFLGRVWIDIDLGNAGTTFPKGTPTDPVNTFTDANTIATLRKFSVYHLEGTLTLAGGDMIAGTDWFGTSHDQSRLNLNGLSNNGDSYCGMVLSGVSNGVISCEDIAFVTLTDFQGEAKNCEFTDTLTLVATSSSDCKFVRCYSGVAGLSTPILDCNGTDADVYLRGYIGGIEIRNFTQGNMTIDLTSGHVNIHSSCTGGTIVVRGVGKLTDGAAGSTVSTDGFIFHQKSGSVTATVTPSTTIISTDLTESLVNHWKESFIRFTSGALTGQVRYVSAYSPTNGQLTFEALSAAPASADRFILITS